MTEAQLPPHLETLAILLACATTEGGAETSTAVANGLLPMGEPPTLSPCMAVTVWKMIGPDKRAIYRDRALLVSRLVHLAANVQEVPLSGLNVRTFVLSRGGSA